MKVVYMISYLKALKKIKDSNLTLSLKTVVKNVEKAITVTDVFNVEKLTGFCNCFRITVENFRIVLFVNKNVPTFARIEYRKDIY